MAYEDVDADQETTTVVPIRDEQLAVIDAGAAGKGLALAAAVVAGASRTCHAVAPLAAVAGSPMPIITSAAAANAGKGRRQPLLVIDPASHAVSLQSAHADPS